MFSVISEKLLPAFRSQVVVPIQACVQQGCGAGEAQGLVLGSIAGLPWHSEEANAGQATFPAPPLLASPALTKHGAPQNGTK